MSLQKQMTFSKAEKDLIRLGRKEERSRIIKLLEERLQLLDQMFIDEPTPYTNGFASAITFIKEEEK